MLENTHEFIHVCLKAAGELGCRIVLVGGAVRDYLAGRAISDYDFVADTDDKELVKALARRIAEKSSGAFVELDAERGFFRIARKDEHADIATRVGHSLLEDAYSRDFTVNAIFRDFADDKYFDPCGGIADLRDNLLRTVAAEALSRDPLRVIRAWRMICKYNMRYDGELETQVREASAKLGKVTSERITEELFYCLGCDVVPHWNFAVSNGILDALFPECKGAFDSARLVLGELDRVMGALPQSLRCHVEARLDKVMAAQRTVRQNLRLAVILGAGFVRACGGNAECGKRTGEAGACGSDDAIFAEDASSAACCLPSAAWLEKACARFCLSRREKKFLAKVVPFCAEPARLYADKQSMRHWNALFRRNAYVPELMLCAYALYAAFTPATDAPIVHDASFRDAPAPAPVPAPASALCDVSAPAPVPAHASALCDVSAPAPVPAHASALCDVSAPAPVPAPALVPVSPAAQPYLLRIKQLFENGDFLTFVIFMIDDFFQEGQVCQPNIPYTGADLAEKYSLSGEAIRIILDELAGISAECGGLSVKDAEEYISEIMNR